MGSVERKGRSVYARSGEESGESFFWSVPHRTSICALRRSRMLVKREWSVLRVDVFTNCGCLRLSNAVQGFM
jgi:hypothetical protein